jgi:hypothetical protein
MVDWTQNSKFLLFVSFYAVFIILSIKKEKKPSMSGVLLNISKCSTLYLSYNALTSIKSVCEFNSPRYIFYAYCAQSNTSNILCIKSNNTMWIIWLTTSTLFYCLWSYIWMCTKKSQPRNFSYYYNLPTVCFLAIWGGRGP